MSELRHKRPDHALQLTVTRYRVYLLICLDYLGSSSASASVAVAELGLVVLKAYTSNIYE